MQLNNQYHHGELNKFQWDFLQFFSDQVQFACMFVIRCVCNSTQQLSAIQGETDNGATPTERMDAFMRLLRIKLGPQMYGTLSGKDSLRLVHPKSAERSSRRQRSKGKIPTYDEGINNIICTNFSCEVFGELPHTAYPAVTHCVSRCHTLCIPLSHILAPY